MGYQATRISAIMFFFLSILFVQGCKTSLLIDVSTSDFRRTFEEQGNKIHYAKGKLAMEMSSSSYCEKKSKDISEMLKDDFKNFKFHSCEQKGTKSNFVAVFEIPIVASHSGSIEKMSSENILFFNPQVHQFNENFVIVRLCLSENKLRELNEKIEKNYFTKLSFKDSLLSISISNNERTTRKIETQDMFVDGNPKPYGHASELKRRQKIEITLSNVNTHHLEKYKSLIVFEFALDPK